MYQEFINPPEKPGCTQTAASESIKQVEEEQPSILEEWLMRVDEDDDTFISKLDDCSLEVWDHYAHLRIAWILLSRYFF
jgi:hypothetical protein